MLSEILICDKIIVGFAGVHVVVKIYLDIFRSLTSQIVNKLFCVNRCDDQWNSWTFNSHLNTSVIQVCVLLPPWEP